MYKKPIIQFKRLQKGYMDKEPLYQELSYNIERGEFLYLTGISGAGKTTLFKLLLGLEAPTQGEVIYNERVIHRIPKRDIPQHRRSFGVVFQDYKLLESKTARENIAIPLLIQGASPKRIAERMDEMEEDLNLSKILDQDVITLSGGERQLVAIARATIHKPQIILADEPTANLDIETSQNIYNIFNRLNKKGATVLFSTHHIEIIKQNPHKTLLIKQHGIVEVNIADRLR